MGMDGCGARGRKVGDGDERGENGVDELDRYCMRVL